MADETPKLAGRARQQAFLRKLVAIQRRLARKRAQTQTAKSGPAPPSSAAPG
jgi:hypothetical protein